MCRSIKPLFNFDPPATNDEIRSASLQFVRKLSGFTRPSKANEVAFNRGVEEIAAAARVLLSSLVTTAEPRDRAVEAAKAHERGMRRFGDQAHGDHTHDQAHPHKHDHDHAHDHGAVEHPGAAPQIT